jgi:hypothetical protein
MSESIGIEPGNLACAGDGDGPSRPRQSAGGRGCEGTRGLGIQLASKGKGEVLYEQSLMEMWPSCHRRQPGRSEGL